MTVFELLNFYICYSDEQLFMDIIILHFLFGVIACIIGAMPFGLVNLSVVDICVKKSEKDALSFSFGASFIEILFALAAIIAGQKLNQLIEGNKLIELGIVLVLISSGVYFFTKKYKENYRPKYEVPFLFKGMLFNLISIQVLLYWFLAVTYLKSNGNIEFSIHCVIGFILGVGFGKMLTLLFYRIISKQIKKRAANISQKINFIIGGLLIIVAMFQLTKAFLN